MVNHSLYHSYRNLDNRGGGDGGGGVNDTEVRQQSRTRAVVLFSACTILLFADQNLMAPNLTAIGNEFGFSEQERDQKLGGDISFAFFLLGAPASIVVGCLADHYHRTRLFAWTVGIGEGACMLTYWSSTYSQLYALRAITGFSLGGAFPLIYSILGDLFPADQRHTVSAIVGIGTGIGTSLGQGIAGFLGPTFGWRLPFLVPSIPALICAVAVWLVVEDPERGVMEEAAQQHWHKVDTANGAPSRQPSLQTSTHKASSSFEMTPLETRRDVRNSQSSDSGSAEFDDDNIVIAEPPAIDWRRQWTLLRLLLSTPSVLLALVQGGPGCVPWGVIGTYLNDFLSENRGMTVERATLVLLVFGVGNFFGQVFGGTGATYLYRIDRRYPALLAGFAAILGCIPFLALLNFVNASSSISFALFVSSIAGFSSAITGPIIKAQLQNVTLPQARGVAFALFNLGDDFGKGLGPVFVAFLIKLMGGRTAAFNVATLGWVFCGILNLILFFTIDKDERTVQSIVAANLSRVREEPVAVFDEETNEVTLNDNSPAAVPERTNLRRRSS